MNYQIETRSRDPRARALARNLTLRWSEALEHLHRGSRSFGLAFKWNKSLDLHQLTRIQPIGKGTTRRTDCWVWRVDGTLDRAERLRRLSLPESAARRLSQSIDAAGHELAWAISFQRKVVTAFESLNAPPGRKWSLRLRNYEPHLIELAQPHAPIGGLEIAGKFFKGGWFTPVRNLFEHLIPSAFQRTSASVSEPPAPGPLPSRESKSGYPIKRGEVTPGNKEPQRVWEADGLQYTVPPDLWREYQDALKRSAGAEWTAAQVNPGQRSLARIKADIMVDFAMNILEQKVYGDDPRFKEFAELRGSLDL